MFERRLYHHIDWALLIAIFALCALGVAMIVSTTSDPTRSNSHLYMTQLYAIGLGAVAMVVTLSIDYRWFTDKSHLIYIGLLALLLYVLFLGMVQMGAGDSGLIKNLGMVLFKDYVLPFEISSVLFLSAMIGAVVIGKKERS